MRRISLSIVIPRSLCVTVNASSASVSPYGADVLTPATLLGWIWISFPVVGVVYPIPEYSLVHGESVRSALHKSAPHALTAITLTPIRELSSSLGRLTIRISCSSRRNTPLYTSSTRWYSCWYSSWRGSCTGAIKWVWLSALPIFIIYAVPHLLTHAELHLLPDHVHPPKRHPPPSPRNLLSWQPHFERVELVVVQQDGGQDASPIGRGG